MSEVSLYRKFRPQTFSSLVGQDHVRITLMNAIRESRLAHAYLFTGPRGTGKTSTARLFAKAINCVNLGVDGEPCEECDICRDITVGRLIDVVEIDAASHTGVDDVRELIDKLHFAPTRARNKVYIVDEVHMLSKGAFNAFLKTLEEPPENVYFVLATTEVHKVPETIISRCQRFDFKRIDEKTVMARLGYIAQMEGIRVEEEALELIARHVDGGLRDAIGLLEQLTVDGLLATSHVKRVLGVAGNSAIEKFFALLTGGDVNASLSFLQELYREGTDFVQFSKDLLEKMRREMLRAVESCDNAAVADRVRMIEIFQKAFDQLRSSLIVQLPLEMAVVKYLSPEGDVAERDGAKNEKERMTVFRPADSLSKKNSDTPPVRAARPIDALPLDQTPVARVAPVAAANLTTEELKKIWPRVAERIRTPKLRVSLKDVQSFEAAGHIITLGFTAKFHLDTVMESSLRTELEEVAGEVAGGGVKIETKLERVELRAPVDRGTNDGSPGASTGDASGEEVDTIVAMFGGEVVE